MMERNVVSLEIAEKLKAAGFPQTAAWSFEQVVDSAGGKHSRTGLMCVRAEKDWTAYGIKRTYFAAPTAQEIADQLREIGRFEMKSSNHEKRIDVWLWITDMSGRMFHAYADTMAEALALLWLKLNDCGCPRPMKYHAINCQVHPGEAKK